MEEHCNVNQDSIAHNTGSKKRAMEDAIPPPNQASTSNAVSHEQAKNNQSSTF